MSRQHVEELLLFVPPANCVLPHDHDNDNDSDSERTTGNRRRSKPQQLQSRNGPNMVTIRERDQQRLAVGHAVWWIPTVNEPPVMVRDEETTPHKLSFGAALKDLLENLSFHCYGKLVEHGHRMQER